MSTETIMAISALGMLVVTIAGFVLNGLRNSLSSLWEQHNAEKQRFADFREEVKSQYLRKDETYDHVSLRLDSMNDRMERIEAQLERIWISASPPRKAS